MSNADARGAVLPPPSILPHPVSTWNFTIADCNLVKGIDTWPPVQSMHTFDAAYSHRPTMSSPALFAVYCIKS